ncbi:MAG: VapC toxin family PIN domain ribonuclease [Kiritimatiellae bacterium]|nr:VapC toxin family PIN domain ribonuclease [Kiritimatiellia bacterium]
MVLVDASVWINHFRTANLKLSTWLDQELIFVHPFIIGELACGNLVDQKEIISLLHDLPSAPKVHDDEIIFFIEQHRIMGCGVGLVDMHLLASCKLATCGLWTADRRLKKIAHDLKIDAD